VSIDSDNLDVCTAFAVWQSAFAGRLVLLRAPVFVWTGHDLGYYGDSAGLHKLLVS
jgi:hypothetical protein